MRNVFLWMSEFGQTLVEVGSEMFSRLTYTIPNSIPIVGGFSLLDIGFLSLPILIIGILIYRFAI